MRFDLFSSGRLHKALAKAKYPDLPAERTLRDWIQNDSAPESARLAVARILSLDAKGKEPPPDWAKALATRDEIATMIATAEKNVTDQITKRDGPLTVLAQEVGRTVAEDLSKRLSLRPDEPPLVDAHQEE